jgi:hypothetical protein
LELTRPTGDFNLNALPADEKLRKLMFIATSGSDVMLTPYAATTNGQTIQEKQKRDDRAFYDAMVGAIASRERIEQFHVEIAELDKRRIDLLAKVDERLRLAEERLQRLRDEAPTIDFPDGSRRKVFRDHDKVRDEFGGIVSSDIIKAEGVSKDTRNWDKNVAFAKNVDALRNIRRDVENAGNEMKADLERSEKNELSDKEMDKRRLKFESDLAKAEKAVADYDIESTASVKGRTFETPLNPTLAFEKARAAEEPALSAPEQPIIKPLHAPASAPVLK